MKKAYRSTLPAQLASKGTKGRGRIGLSWNESLSLPKEDKSKAQKGRNGERPGRDWAVYQEKKNEPDQFGGNRRRSRPDQKEKEKEYIIGHVTMMIRDRKRSGKRKEGDKL